MAGYQVSAGVFKAKDAEPEVTLELFEDYCKKMERMFRLQRRINPKDGSRIEFDDQERKDFIRIEGGDDMDDLFEHVGKIKDTDTYNDALDKIRTELKKQGNRTSAVFKLFNGHGQGQQSFDVWHRSVYKAAKLIDWTGYDAEKACVDAITMQTSSDKLRQKVIQENPSYTDLVKLGISMEQAKIKADKMPDGETIRRVKHDKDPKVGRTGEESPRKSCKRCKNPRCRGGEECFARDKICNKCGQKGHFSRSSMCPKRKERKEKDKKEKEISGKVEYSESSGEESSSRILVTTVGRVKNKGESTILTEIEISDINGEGGKEIELATDTGVSKTILNRKDWEKIQNRCKLIGTKIRFRPWGTQEQLPIMGRAKIQMRAKAGAVITTYVYPSRDEKDTSLQGKKDAVRLGIVHINLEGKKHEVKGDDEEMLGHVRQLKRKELQEADQEEKRKDNRAEMDRIIQDHKELFEGVGKYNGEPVRIQLEENVKPVIQPPRRIPLHYVQPLNDHLEELLKEDVIEGPINQEEQGTWISNLVITDKKWDKARGPEERVQIRANLDLRELNEYVYQTHTPIPTVEELRHELRDSDTFTTLDMTHSFHQFVLEEKDRKLFTFRAPRGLMRFKRLVMGNNPASSEAHRRVAKVVEGLEGALQIKDDVLLHGRGKEHDERLRKVLKRFQEAGLTLRKEKCVFGEEEVKWFGMVYSKYGMQADPDKVKLIKEWKEPRTVREVKSFLQTVQFNAPYMAAEEEGELNYPALTAPLRALTKRGTKFTWTKEHQKHFDIIKERLCGERVMVPFDPKRKTRLYTDGGPEGCQGTVTQRYDHPEAGEQWRPVAHTARAWTETEKNYSQIEKESLALYSMTVSNKMYLLGINYEAAVDHKPLIPLYNNPKRPKQMRVDRHRMKLAGYRFKVIHVPGSKIPCDYGSRRGCPKATKYSKEQQDRYGIEDDNEVYVNRVVDDTLPDAVTKEMMVEATEKDDEMGMLKEDIQTGNCRNGLVKYKQVFDELSVVDGLVMRGERLVVPKELRPIVVMLAHEGHLGQDKTLGLLRETTWFPGMGQMVTQLVESCLPCLAAVPTNKLQPLKMTKLPEGPWQVVHADFKGPIGNQYYLHTIIDQYSKYPIVEVCKSTSWEDMEPMLKNDITTMGTMDKLISNGGPPYNSEKFKKFAKKHGFVHHICTPENPEANGFVEIFQKVLVKIIHTAMIEKKDPKKKVQEYLAQYKAAPHKTTGRSPFEIMFNRKMKTKLPQIKKKKESEMDKEIREKHDREKDKQKSYADKKRRNEEKEVKEGDKVLIKRTKTTTKSPWDPEAYKVKEVKGDRLKLERDGSRLDRAKGKVKVVPERPEIFKRRERVRKRVESESEVDMSKLRRRFEEQQEGEKTQRQAQEEVEEHQQDQTQEQQDQGTGETVAEEEEESSFDENDYEYQMASQEEREAAGDSKDSENEKESEGEGENQLEKRTRVGRQVKPTWKVAERSPQARKRRKGQAARREKTRIPDPTKKKEGRAVN